MSNEKKLFTKNMYLLLLDYAIFLLVDIFTRIEIHSLLFLFSIPLIVYFWFISNRDWKKLLKARDELIFGFISFCFVLSYMIFIDPVARDRAYKSVFLLLFLNAFVEELYFRFCYLGWFKKNVKQDKLILINLVSSVLLFTFSHRQYSAWNERYTLLIQGTIYAITYYYFGLIPATLMHFYWNVYVKKYLIIFQSILFISLFISKKYIFNRINTHT